MSENEEKNPWDKYKRYTAARIGLPRSGASIGTKEMLQFRYDHAKARDAVWTDCDFDKIQTELQKRIPTHVLHSQAMTREAYLLRPDLGRKLDASSVQELQTLSLPDPYDVVFCVVDGLSPFAISENLLDFLTSLLDDLKELKVGPVICVKNGRVAVGDQVSEILNAKMVVVLIGERPGLSSADSMGAYLTYAPTIGTTDERRNCISNIRPAGLSLDKAKAKLLYLLKEAFQKQLTGVGLKDRMDETFGKNDQNSIT